ncbi:Phytosulfokines 2 [Nymphaea thermarum]|nr:Phytosulfokines 2 [Nymphaea thermarum]
MARRFLFFFIAFLLVSSVAIAARPQPSMPGLADSEAPSLEDEDADCENSSEDCLIRRTLVAHTDYIYTQGKGKKP